LAVTLEWTSSFLETALSAYLASAVLDRPVRWVFCVPICAITFGFARGDKINPMLYGYARVSSDKQKNEQQQHALARVNIPPGNFFQDKEHGWVATRPGLDALLAAVRPGDTIIVWKSDRMMRSLQHMLDLMSRFDRDGVKFKSLTEPELDTTTAAGKMLSRILAVFAEFERDLIVERTKSGVDRARREGKQIGRPQAMETPEMRQMALDLWEQETELDIIASRVDAIRPPPRDPSKQRKPVHRTTVYRFLAAEGKINRRRAA
jgi:DNA invertase Pin-like site-specific DNA recombinase